MLMASFDCTVIGDIFLDIIVQFNGNYEQFFHGGTSYCNFAKTALGGAGNIATALSTLGGKVAFVGKAGDDFFGRLYLQDLKRSEVVPKVFFDESSPTGLVIVFVSRGKERSFLVFRGANEKLLEDEIEKVSDEIRRSKYVYFSGYSLVNDPQKNAILRAIELARRFKVKIVFDPGAYNLVNANRKLFTDLMHLCDVFSPNLDEALAITNTRNLEDLIPELTEKVPLTALKCGMNGCILFGGKNIVKVPSYNVECMDPTGAGDAFTAAIIYGQTHRLRLESTGKLANWFASEVVAHVGSRSFPSKSKIYDFLRSLGNESTKGVIA